jgi:hypothetical protein
VPSLCVTTLSIKPTWPSENLETPLLLSIF